MVVTGDLWLGGEWWDGGQIYGWARSSGGGGGGGGVNEAVAVLGPANISYLLYCILNCHLHKTEY